MRQMHHWAALLFMAAIVVHMLRIFFTGAFRKPRELNWIIGSLLFWIGFLAGFSGYSLPDDALSGTGLRIASGIVLSMPVIGTWVMTSLFGGEFPGDLIIGRFFILHVLLIPGALLALITVHLGLVFKQKHTQWPGPGRTNSNVVGERLFPRYVIKQTGFFMAVFGRDRPARLACCRSTRSGCSARTSRRSSRRRHSRTGTSWCSTGRSA